MKLYEIFAILNPQLKEEEVNSFVQELEQKLSQEGAEIKKREIKINEQLAYFIKKKNIGHVVKMEILASPEKNIAKMVKEHTATNENIFRLLIFNKPEIEEKKDTIIDQIRKQERRRPAEVTATIPTPAGPENQTKIKEEADITEIDKKIEELLT